MKAIVGGIGAFLMWITVIWAWFVGVLLLYTWLGWVGVAAGAIVFPVPMIIALGSWFFSSWLSFFCTVFWFALIALIINYGDN